MNQESERQIIELSDGTKITLPKGNGKLEKMTREEFFKRQKEVKN